MTLMTKSASKTFMKSFNSQLAWRIWRLSWGNHETTVIFKFAMVNTLEVSLIEEKMTNWPSLASVQQFLFKFQKNFRNRRIRYSSLLLKVLPEVIGNRSQEKRGMLLHANRQRNLHKIQNSHKYERDVSKLHHYGHALANVRSKRKQVLPWLRN